MKKKYYAPEMEEMEVEMPSLLENTAETGTVKPCDDHVPACEMLFG